jgi:hypothetical protein
MKTKETVRILPDVDTDGVVGIIAAYEEFLLYKLIVLDHYKIKIQNYYYIS